MNCTCPACGSQETKIIYQQDQTPVHSVLVHHTREDALNLTKGQIDLTFCQTCGFIYNSSFNSALQDYSAEYESTQGYSPTFNAFSHNLASHLVERYDLRNKDLIEIGSGQGEFIKALCELGDNRGVGFDPAFTPGRLEPSASGQPVIIRDYYSEAYKDYRADFIACKMTLEHIQPVKEFVSTVRRSIGDERNTVVFFQVPDVDRIMQETAFWDVYYEHCSYFSLGSLARVFRASGFDVVDLWRGYGDQYLMIEARPALGQPSAPLQNEDDLGNLQNQVQAFTSKASQAIAGWYGFLQARQAAGEKVALWGGGSKAVAFLTAIGAADSVACAVDINPHKHNTFLAGTSTPVVPPESLKSLKPTYVVAMNPIYSSEIWHQLSSLDLAPTLLTVNDGLSLR